MLPDSFHDNGDELVVAVLKKPFDRPKGDHLCCPLIITHLIDQIHYDPENMKRVRRCPSEKVHVEITGNVTTPLCIEPRCRVCHGFF
jgi:hypothetical protein